MKIVHYLKWLNMREGGTVRAVLELCRGLADRGHEVTVFTADDTDVPAAWRKNPIARAGMPRSVRVTIRDRLSELRGKTAEQVQRDTPTQLLDRGSMHLMREVVAQADVLHLHGPWASSNLQLAAAARKLRVPYIVSSHGMLDEWCMAQGSAKKRLHLALFSRRMLEYARAVHCTAQGELDQARKHFPRGRGVVVPLLFDTTPFQNLPGPGLARARFPALLTPHPKLLFLSRLNMKKGVEQLITAAAELRRRGTVVTLLIAGPSDPPRYEAQLRTKAAELGIAEHCHFLGMVKGLEKIALYQAADLFVLPTSQENFGFVLLEALAAGTPVVTTRGVDIWPELAASGGAEIIGPGQPLAATLAVLLADPARRIDMSTRGRAWAMSFLDEGRTLGLFEDMYRGASQA